MGKGIICTKPAKNVVILIGPHTAQRQGKKYRWGMFGSVTAEEIVSAMSAASVMVVGLVNAIEQKKLLKSIKTAFLRLGRL